MFFAGRVELRRVELRSKQAAKMLSTCLAVIGLSGFGRLTASQPLPYPLFLIDTPGSSTNQLNSDDASVGRLMSRVSREANSYLILD